MLSDIIHKQDFCPLCRDLITVVRRNAALRRHKWRIGEDDIVSIVPLFEARQGIVLADIGVGKAVQIHIHTGEPYHVRRNVIARKIPGHAGFIVSDKRGLALLVQICLFDVVIGADKEARRTTGRVEDRLILGRRGDLYHHVNDVARCAELTGVTLAAHNGEQILKGIAQLLTVLIGEFRDFF